MRNLPINTFASLDPNNLLDESKSVIKFISNYYENIEKHPVQSQVEPGYLASILPSTAPYYPESLDDILDDVTNKILPGITHWQSPNFFGYFQANASTAGFLGEMLCSGLNVVGFNWIASPAATELESVVMDWLGNMLKLPSSFLFSGNGGGVLHGSTCEALLCTLVAARDRALNCIGEDKITKLVVYASDQTHFSLQKTAKLIGISSRNIRALPTSSCDEFALSPATLRLAIEEDVKAGLVPLYLCATIGTTATGAIDPIKDLGNVAKAYNLWFHVDAAYAGSACICPEFRHYLDGIELGDSFSMNSHKWLLTNMECCCLWLQNPNSLIQSLSTDSEITKYNPGNTESNYLVDYKDWQIALSRRFKAIKLWLVIRKHGVANLMYHIRSDIEMAKAFEDMVKNDPRFEIVVPRRFALVCFRLRAAALTLRSGGLSCNDVNKKLLESVNASGRGFMTHGVVGDVYFIRCAIGATLTEMRHVKQLWILVQESTQNVCI